MPGKGASGPSQKQPETNVPNKPTPALKESPVHELTHETASESPMCPTPWTGRLAAPVTKCQAAGSSRFERLDENQRGEEELTH